MNAAIHREKSCFGLFAGIATGCELPEWIPKLVYPIAEPWTYSVAAF